VIQDGPEDSTDGIVRLRLTPSHFPISRRWFSFRSLNRSRRFRFRSLNRSWRRFNEVDTPVAPAPPLNAMRVNKRLLGAPILLPWNILEVWNTQEQLVADQVSAGSAQRLNDLTFHYAASRFMIFSTDNDRGLANSARQVDVLEIGRRAAEALLDPPRRRATSALRAQGSADLVLGEDHVSCGRHAAPRFDAQRAVERAAVGVVAPVLRRDSPVDRSRPRLRRECPAYALPTASEIYASPTRHTVDGRD
jgi:hypothetical protein